MEQTIEALKSIKNQLEHEYMKIDVDSNIKAIEQLEIAITATRRAIIALTEKR